MATPVIAHIKRSKQMSSASASWGQRFWWLRDTESGEFIKIPGGRGHKALDIEVSLIPGRKYVLGVGPANKYGYRSTVVVDELGVELP